MVKKTSKLEEYKYLAIVIGASALISLGLIFVIGRPLYNSMEKTNADLKEKKLVLAKLETNLETLKGLEARQAEIKSKNEKVLAALPADKDVSRLFVQFEKIAAGAGLQIQSVSETGAAITANNGTVAPDSTTAGVGTIMPVSYQVTGKAKSYASLKKALDRIEDALRIVSVSKINVQGNGELTVTLVVDTYARSEQ